MQPTETNGNLLLFNGEIFGGIFDDLLQTENDTQCLSDALNEAQSHADLLSIISCINGPFAFIYWKKGLQRLYYGRDILGRRSLLKLKMDHGLILGSVAEVFKEVK